MPAGTTVSQPAAPPGRPADKLVAVLADDLPPGLAANAGTVLGVSLGRLFPGIVGPDVVDASGTVHPGLTTRPLPVLATGARRLAELADKARVTPGLTVVGLTRTAQQARSYPDYTARMAELATERQHLVGLALHGPHAAVTSLVGDLPLYR